MSISNLLQLPEGVIFYQFHTPRSTTSPALARPTLLFIHAAIADHTLWDDQVSYFKLRGWDVCCYDMFGYGRSLPSQAYLQQDQRPAIKHFEHTASVVRSIHALKFGESGQEVGKVVVIGLSRGACVAVDFAIAYPRLVAGLVTIAGGLSGFEHPNLPAEEAIFAREPQLVAAKDVEGLVDLNVRAWGDGPMQEVGRANELVREKLRIWYTDIATRECNSTGGAAIEYEVLEPPAALRLSEINVPIGVGIGILDESSTVAAMRYIGTQGKNVTVQEFDTAHMVNLEASDQFNTWLEAWLEASIT